MHPVFADFECFRGIVAPGYHVNFLGVMTRNAFAERLIAALGHQLPRPGDLQAEYPKLNEEYFEWIDVLEAVLAARRAFTMVELGAGFGRWLVNAAAAARQRRPDLRITLVGVEAEPTHFAWLQQHFRDNGLDPAKHILIEAAIDAREGVVGFYVGKPDEWYGQRIADPDDTAREVKPVKAVTLQAVLAGLESVDLIDLDIEGAELAVLSSAIEELDRKVMRVHIGTHTTAIERGLRTLFRDHGWTTRNDYEVGSTEVTPWGSISFGNGVQTWINTRLLRTPPTAAELDWLQWGLRTWEARYGRLQDELHERTLAASSIREDPRLQAALDAAKEARDRIAAMESSKFWKLRRAWFRFKRCLGRGMNE